MKRITIGNKEYTLTFNIMASLYSECTETIMNEFMSYGKIMADRSVDNLLDGFVKSVANTTEEVVILLYASLLEYHGTRRGDGTVKSKEDALDLLYAYLEENEGKTIYDVYTELLEVVADDNFFDKTGLNKRLEMMFESTKKKTTRKKKSSPGENL